MTWNILMRAVPRFMKPTLQTLATPDAAETPAAAYIDPLTEPSFLMNYSTGFCSLTSTNWGDFGGFSSSWGMG